MDQIYPQLKRLSSPDIHDFDSFQPDDEDCFAFLLDALFGPERADGEESFSMMVCTPKWLERELEERKVISGRNYLVVKQYDIDAIRSYLNHYAARCSGENWQVVAQKLSRIGSWELEE